MRWGDGGAVFLCERCRTSLSWLWTAYLGAHGVLAQDGRLDDIKDLAAIISRLVCLWG